MQNFANQNHHCRAPGHDHEEAKQNPPKDCNICYYKHQKLECNPCRYLENPSALKEVDYFTFFCLDKRYDLDKPTLVSQFKLFQKFIHPDRFSQAKDCLQGNSHELSSFANNAYFTLLNDLTRATYLLKLLYHLDVTKEESQTKHLVSEDFLKRVFEYNCEVEDTSEDQEGLLALQTDIMTQY